MINQVVFLKTTAMFWMIIGADATLSVTTKFSVPKTIKILSWGHMHNGKLEKTEAPTIKSSYLRLSQAGAVTPYQQYFSSTSLMYDLVNDKTAFRVQILFFFYKS